MTAALLAAGVVVAGCSGSSGAGPSASGAGSSAAAPSVADSYGALPTFLPTISAQPNDGVVTGSVGHPAVTSEGDVVLAKVTGNAPTAGTSRTTGTVQATVTGPVVPGEGLPHVSSATTCTWTVTFADATTSVPIKLGDFITVDEDGHRYAVRFVPGAPRPPATLRPGHRTTFELRAVMNTGEGVMRWQPAGHALAVWDFVVEND